MEINLGLNPSTYLKKSYKEQPYEMLYCIYSRVFLKIWFTLSHSGFL